MGPLKYAGELLTYNHYKDKNEQYKKHAILQIKSLVKAHISRSIALD